MNLTPAQFLEKHVISELIRQGFATDVANIGAREALKFYRRTGSGGGKNKVFDECLSVAKTWAVKSQTSIKIAPARSEPAGPPGGVPCPRGGGPAENG
ncbi:hypothetical protein [Pantoea sp. NGS-ED-1003]|uniref:hypothetical protein n=1 Tax=Pantoea sp. NGS-ED-1003 TaxID=1526743 RepID=UPI00090789F6|nr:hypothetical protein [Pantoea sp. NGS-ED-1003]